MKGIPPMAGGQGRALGSGSIPDAPLARKSITSCIVVTLLLLKGACREMGAFLLITLMVLLN